MNKKALILDLDNTIYPVSSIGDQLFAPLFQLIAASGDYTGDFASIKQDIMRRPFQKVAAEHTFSRQLTHTGIALLKELTVEQEMAAYDDYAEVKKLPLRKFLVTTGFTNMQRSKVEKLGIKPDFEEIHIVDPCRSHQTKKDIFKSIVEQHHFSVAEVLVVGDDPHSEIQAAMELGIDAVVYDKPGFNQHLIHPTKIDNFSQLEAFI
jgi:putative hydrolase of the HAD superfamily